MKILHVQRTSATNNARCTKDQFPTDSIRLRSGPNFWMIVRRNFVATFVDLAKAPFCHRYFPFLSSKLTGCTRILCFTDDRHPTLSWFSERDAALPSVASAIGAVLELQLFATLPVCTRRLSRLSFFGASLHFFDSYKTSFPLEVFAGEDHVNSFFFPLQDFV